MRTLTILGFIFFMSCQQGTRHGETTSHQTDTSTTADTPVLSAEFTTAPDSSVEKKNPGKPDVYSNKRFRNVTVTLNSSGDYVVQGEGQIFEANFNWMIVDNEKELKKGYAMTDAGAPEWGSFRFTVRSVNKINPEKKLQLILYESSAKDGSRQHELEIPLPG